MKYIFVHGGPGLNSNPERNILKPLIEVQGHELLFWNEPSLLRGQICDQDHAYQYWLNSLSNFIIKNSGQEQVAIIAHSFAAFAINDILPEVGTKIGKLILIAPVFDLMKLDQNLIDLAIRFHARDANIAGIVELEELKRNMPDNFNEKRFSIILKAIGHEEVLPSYWHNKKVSALYNQFFVEDQYQFDLQSFKAVRQTITHEKVRNRFSGTVKIYYGALDPVARLEQDYALLMDLYPNHRLLIGKESGHYPHIEEQELFSKHFFEEDHLALGGENRI